MRFGTSIHVLLRMMWKKADLELEKMIPLPLIQPYHQVTI